MLVEVVNGGYSVIQSHLSDLMTTRYTHCLDECIGAWFDVWRKRLEVLFSTKLHGMPRYSFVDISPYRITIFKVMCLLKIVSLTKRTLLFRACCFQQ